MTRVTVDIDEQTIARIMQRYGVQDEREALDLALRIIAGDRLTVEEARAMRGIGWDGDLDEMRGRKPL